MEYDLTSALTSVVGDRKWLRSSLAASILDYTDWNCLDLALTNMYPLSVQKSIKFVTKKQLNIYRTQLFG